MRLTEPLLPDDLRVSLPDWAVAGLCRPWMAGPEASRDGFTASPRRPNPGDSPPADLSKKEQITVATLSSNLLMY